MKRRGWTWDEECRHCAIADVFSVFSVVKGSALERAIQFFGTGNVYFTQSRPCFVPETMGHSFHLVSRTLIRCI